MLTKEQIISIFNKKSIELTKLEDRTYVYCDHLQGIQKERLKAQIEILNEILAGEK